MKIVMSVYTRSGWPIISDEQFVTDTEYANMRREMASTLADPTGSVTVLTERGATVIASQNVNYVEFEVL